MAVFFVICLTMQLKMFVLHFYFLKLITFVVIRRNTFVLYERCNAPMVCISVMGAL